MPYVNLRRLFVVALIVVVLYPFTVRSAASSYDLAVSVNHLRYQAGLPYLAGDWKLDSYAQAHAETMAVSGSVFHSDIWPLVKEWSRVGENVGAGPSLWSVVSAFQASLRHAENIYGEWTHLGVGVVETSGRMYVVTVFAK